MAKQLKEIEIPFGAKDSELWGWEYTIPNGMEATIVDNKIVVKKKELKKIEQKKDMHDKLTAFESSLKHIIEEAIECGDTHNLKADADMLLRLAQKPWSEKDEQILSGIIGYLCTHDSCELEGFGEWYEWLKSLKDRVLPQPKQDWSEDDEDILNTIINHFKIDIECTDEDDTVRWLKSLKDKVVP